MVSSEDYNPELIDSVDELLQHLSTGAAKYTSTYYREPCGSNGILLFMFSVYAFDIRFVGCSCGDN